MVIIRKGSEGKLDAGGRLSLPAEIGYFQAVEGMVKQVVQDGGTLQDALHQTLPPPFNEWQVIGRRFEANMHSFYNCHKNNQ